MKYIFLDTETTGLSKDELVMQDTASGTRQVLKKGDEVIQIGGLITDANLNPIRLFCHHCDTTVCNMEKKALDVHGITMEFLRTYVKDIFLEEVIETLIPELYEDNIVTIGYNIDNFDVTMIKQTLRDSEHQPYFGVPVVNSIIPSNGRYTLDLVPFFIKNYNGKQFRQKLEVLAKQREKQYQQFCADYSSIPLDTNIPLEKAFPNGISSHNSMYDSVICYLLMKELWKRKLH